MDNFINSIKKNYKYIIFLSFILLLTSAFIYDLHISNGISNKVILSTILFLNLAIITFYSVYFKKKSNMKLENLYLLMIIPIGILYLILFPLNTIPDENTHFMRIYEISEGHLISKIDKKTKSQGRYFDKKIYESVMSSKDYKSTLKNISIRKSNQKEFYHFSNTALYSFVCYIPQVLGLLVGKLLNLPLLLQAYLARLFNFIVFIILTYMALKIMPIKKDTLFLILFFPLVIQEAISLSPDALTIGITFLLISYVLYLKNERVKKITKMETIILSILTIVLSLCKIVYLPICFILFLLPCQKFKNNKNKIITLSIILLIAIISNLVWLKISSGFLPSGENAINSSEQLKYVFSNIARYMKIMFSTYSKEYHSYIFNSFGSSLGCFEIEMYELYLIPLLLIFMFSLFVNNEKVSNKTSLNVVENIFILCIVFSVIMLISTSLYLQWTPVGSNTILGIQGRYFIPLYILLPLVFSKFKTTPRITLMNKYTYIYLLSLNLYAVCSIYYRFI